MRRVVSLWLPRFATDLRHRQARRQTHRRSGAPSAEPASGPLVLVDSAGGRLELAAVDGAAAAEGLVPGLPLADARALVPRLRSAPYDPAGDARALVRLAEWCGRYTPWCAPDASGGEAGGGAGLLLDVTGCAHLFGPDETAGEAALLADLTARLGRLGLSARGALAATPGAAWALARFGRAAVLPADADLRAVLAPLPPAALRLPPATCALLERLGLREIGALFDLPPASLAPRFGPLVARRLAQALGSEAEPIAPLRPVAPHRVRHVFPEPVVTTEPLAAALVARLAELCRGLEAAQCGARRLALELYRVDGTLRRLSLGVSRPSRDPAHLGRLFAEHLERIDPGFGLEALVLAAPEVEPLEARQLGLGTGASAGGDPAEGELAALVDRLSSRLGPAAVRRLVPRESRLPERAVAMPAMLEDSGPEAPAKETAWRPPAAPPRPARLLPRPEPIEAVALLPDDPPALFRWRRLRHRVTRAEGPERLSPEWWREAPESGPFRAAPRDYYRVEVEDGRRYWLYRAAGCWYLHGLFG